MTNDCGRLDVLIQKHDELAVQNAALREALEKTQCSCKRMPTCLECAGRAYPATDCYQCKACGSDLVDPDRRDGSCVRCTALAQPAPAAVDRAKDPSMLILCNLCGRSMMYHRQEDGNIQIINECCSKKDKWKAFHEERERRLMNLLQRARRYLPEFPNGKLESEIDAVLKEAR